MSAEKRSVTTDALETLGTIIDESAGRDAIHLAVEPVVAATNLWAGSDVGLLPDGRATNKGVKLLGIVDPFLKGGIKSGDRFWLVVYPRQITSLRHVWAHPSFPDREVPVITESADDPVSVSTKWIEQFAANIDQTYSRLMSAAEDWAENGEYTYDNTESYKDHWDKFPEFWKHYEVVTGRKVDDQSSFFTCSC